jgi:hypothetical protein
VHCGIRDAGVSSANLTNGDGGCRRGISFDLLRFRGSIAARATIEHICRLAMASKRVR